MTRASNYPVPEELELVANQHRTTNRLILLESSEQLGQSSTKSTSGDKIRMRESKNLVSQGVFTKTNKRFELDGSL